VTFSLSEPATGVSPPETIRAMSGLEFIEGIAAGRLPRPPISALLDFHIVEVEAGRVVFAGTPGAEHYNPMGTVHGGYIATLLDSCMTCAVHTLAEAGQGCTTLELKVNFTRALPADAGVVRAEGKVIHAGRQIGTAEGRLVDAEGRLFAHATTTCMMFKIPESKGPDGGR
jgi:uncharacterized protein (TIGR00369 family)